MSGATTDTFKQVAVAGSATTLTVQKNMGDSSIAVASTSGIPITTGVVIAIRQVDGSGNEIANTYTEWNAVVSGGSGFAISPVPIYGNDQVYPSGSTTQVFVPVSALAYNQMITGILAHANQDGSLKTAAVQAALNIPTTPGADWSTLGTAPSTIVYNGNRSYNLTFSGTNYTDRLMPGTRLKLTRTVAAPTQSASLNGTNQYFNRSATINGMTFTNNFVVGAWVKYTGSYGTAAIIAGRYNGTSGWDFGINTSGQVFLEGFNAGSGNVSNVVSYQSLPTNKWVHVTAQLDMATFTATPTTSYVMIDGVDVPASVSRAGTNPTALVQAGNLEIGSRNGGLLPWTGKIAQAFIASAKIAEATVQTLITQGLTPALITANNIVSAYSLNGVITDLNTTNANDLTANNSATATNADSPFGGQAGGAISSTLEYAIIQKVTFSTDTTAVVQVPEGCALPTSGGIAAASYASVKAPFGMPVQRGKWRVETYLASVISATNPGGAWFGITSFQLSIPVGEWMGGYSISADNNGPADGGLDFFVSLSTSSSTESDRRFTSVSVSGMSSATILTAPMVANKEKSISISTATPYYFIAKTANDSGTLYVRGDEADCTIYAENAYL